MAYNPLHYFPDGYFNADYFGNGDGGEAPVSFTASATSSATAKASLRAAAASLSTSAGASPASLSTATGAAAASSGAASAAESNQVNGFPVYSIQVAITTVEGANESNVFICTYERDGFKIEKI
jgi:hypothetical protein